MKKRNSLFFLASVLTLIESSFVIAAPINFDNMQGQMTNAIDFLLDILSPFFQKVIGDYGSSDFFFSKILLLILLVIITRNVLDRTPITGDNKKVSLIISLIISILAIRFINENNFFGAIFVQYGALGISIVTILPMVIFFYFVHNTNVGTYGRKVFWTLYAITLGAIWISKQSEIPNVANWIYGLTFVAAIIFIFFDKSIHSYFGLSGFKKFERESNRKRIREVKAELDKIDEHFQKRRMSFAEYKQEKKQLEDYIKELSKE